MQPTSPTTVSWKRNLVTMGVAQALAGIGFSLVFPFMPLFVRHVGRMEDPGQAALWAGLVNGLFGLTIFLASPVWGVLGDRYGKKKNVLRAMFGTAAFFSLTGLAINLPQLIVLQALTGLFTGVMGTTQALVAATIPRNRVAFGLGVVQAGAAVGGTLGPALGALLAAKLGLRSLFLASGGMLALSGCLVLMLAREEVVRPSKGPPPRLGEGLPRLFRLVTSRQMARLLAMLFVVTAVPNLMLSTLPLLLAELDPGGGIAATGVAFALMSAAGIFSSYLGGWLAIRLGLRRILVGSCLGAGISLLPMVALTSIPASLTLLVLFGLFLGALMTASAGMVALAAPRDQQGAAFGGLQSVTAAGYNVGPLAGGLVAATLGLRAVFLVQGTGLMAAAGLVAWLLGQKREQVPQLVGAGATPHTETRH